MKNTKVSSVKMFVAGAFLLLVAGVAPGYDEYNRCLVKYKSEWSKPCSQCQDHSKSYRAYFRNECSAVIDVKVAAQESDRRWKTFTRLSVQPGDTLVGYACKGTGKYLFWTRKAGDAAVVFPSDAEIDSKYTK
jgi:hypothetical protein